MATKLEIYNEALRLVGDLRLTSTSDQVEARYALDDAWSRSVLFAASQANWPHAYNSRSVALANDTSSPGYNKSYTISNSTWLRTVSVSLDQHFAVGAHYHQALGKLFLNTTANSVFVRYIDSTYLSDSNISTWPEIFCSVVSHRLAFEVCERLTQDPQKAQTIYQLFAEVLNIAKSQIALETSAMMISPAQWAAKVHNDGVAAIWEEALRLMGTGDPKVAMIQRPVDAKPIHQIMEMAWRGAVLYCLNEGYWNFAARTQLFNTTAGTGIGYTHSFTKPANWIRTVAVSAGTDSDFKTAIEYRDEAGRWFANSPSIYVRYISSDYSQDSDVAVWPDSFKRLLACRLAYECVDLVTGIPDKRALLEKEYATVLARAVQQDAADSSLAIPRKRNTAVSAIWSSALRIMGYSEAKKADAPLQEEAARVYQHLDGAWPSAALYCLTEGNWNFATTSALITTTTSSPILGFRFPKPSNWVRTVTVSEDGSAVKALPYRDEGGFIYAASNSIYLRYVSSTASSDNSVSSWPESFADIVALRLASECVDVVTGDPNRRAAILEEYKSTLASALAKDAANQSLLVPKLRPAAVANIWSEAIRLMGYAETKKPTLERENDAEGVYLVIDGAWERVVNFCLSEAYWNFATLTTSLSSSGSVIPGYTNGFAKPANWVRTVLVSANNSFSKSLEYRDEGGRLYANASPIFVRYISSALASDAQSASWPESFRRVLAYRLAYECVEVVSGDPNKRGPLLEEYKAVLASAVEKDASDTNQFIPKRRNDTISEIWEEALRLVGYHENKKANTEKALDNEAVYQLMDSAWPRIVRYCLTEGFWNFATDIASISSSGAAELGYSFGFNKPSDWLRTINIASDDAFSTYVEYRDQGGRLFANVSPLFIRYVSTSQSGDASATSWPESFRRVLACRLAYEIVEPITGDPNRRAGLLEEYKLVLTNALSKDASDETLTIPKRRNSTVTGIWQEALRLVGYQDTRQAGVETRTEREAVYQILDAAWPRVARFVLTEGYWNFATVTASIAASGTSSLGYTHGFTKPSDWLRTINVSSDNDFSDSIEYRDQGGRFFANSSPIFVRYVSAASSVDGSSAQWPETFRRVLAYRLAYEIAEAVTKDPNRRAGLLEEYKAELASALAKEASDQSLTVPKRRNSTISAIWSEALRLMGYPDTRNQKDETRVEREAAYQILDSAWIRVVKFCLHEAYWNFATVTTTLTASGATIPGWQYAFNKPANWLRTIAVSNTPEMFTEARYHDEGGKLYANTSTLYIRYISSAASADAQAPNWPELFCRVLAYRLAYECADVVMGDPNRSTKLLQDYKAVISSAKNKDAMDQSQMFPKTSNWLGAMRGGSGRRYDRGPMSGF